MLLASCFNGFPVLMAIVRTATTTSSEPEVEEEKPQPGAVERDMYVAHLSVANVAVWCMHVHKLRHNVRRQDLCGNGTWPLL